MEAEGKKDDWCHWGLGKDINKKKIRSFSLRRLRGKEKRKNTCLWKF